jgi:hypothetical protein
MSTLDAYIWWSASYKKSKNEPAGGNNRHRYFSKNHTALAPSGSLDAVETSAC